MRWDAIDNSWIVFGDGAIYSSIKKCQIYDGDVIVCFHRFANVLELKEKVIKNTKPWTIS